MYERMKSFIQDGVVYVARMRQFKSTDWLVYGAWIGLMFGLFLSVSGFIAWGIRHGVPFPEYVLNIPVGIGIFVSAIAVDTIGHRTIYKEELQKAEKLVHHMTMAAGISSTVLMCLAYEHRELARLPAYVMSGLTIFYSVIDEAMHWKRFIDLKSDRIEMWSHFFIFTGHLLMTVAWLYWMEQGYPGVNETLQTMKL